jgi:hypothetical protein
VTLQDLGALGDLIGGLGVVVTLAYLAVQVRQNSSLITAQTVQASVDATQRVLLVRVENASLRSILRKGRGGQPLDADEAEVIASYLQAAFMNFQARLQHHRRGVFDESANESYELILEDYLAQGYVRRWWLHAKALFGTHFRDHCERIIAAQDAGATPPVPDWRVMVEVLESPRPDDTPTGRR